MNGSFTPRNGRHEMPRYLLARRQGLHRFQSPAPQCTHPERGCCLPMNSLLMSLVLFSSALGFGYTIERTAQDAPLVAFAPRRDPVWLRDLDPSYQELVGVMRQKGFTIEENAKICKKHDVVGFYSWGDRAVKVCTARIASLNGEPSAFRALLQQTIAHEAVHVAQSCRLSRVGKSSLELSAARLYALPQSVRSEIERSLATAYYDSPRSVRWRIEAEAMAMEDTPDQVIAALKRFCR